MEDRKIIELYNYRSENALCKFCSNGTPILKLAVHPF